MRINSYEKHFHDVPSIFLFVDLFVLRYIYYTYIFFLVLSVMHSGSSTARHSGFIQTLVQILRGH